MPTFAPGTLTSTSVPDTLHVAGREISGFSRLAPDQAMLLRLRMIEAARDCGCQWGGAVGGLALHAYLAWSLLAPYLRGAPTTFSWWWAIGALAAGCLLGKAFGTFRARRALLDAIAELQRLTGGANRIETAVASAGEAR